jgi:hypothetical protein
LKFHHDLKHNPNYLTKHTVLLAMGLTSSMDKQQPDTREEALSQWYGMDVDVKQRIIQCSNAYDVKKKGIVIYDGGVDKFIIHWMYMTTNHRTKLISMARKLQKRSINYRRINPLD